VYDWWWNARESQADDPRLVVAWTGHNAAARRAGNSLRLFKSTWVNPLPLVEVTSIDYISAMTKPIPFLIALTVE
jgi:hypothetical protein